MRRNLLCNTNNFIRYRFKHIPHHALFGVTRIFHHNILPLHFLSPQDTRQRTATTFVTTTAPTKPTAPSTDPEETEQNPVKPQKEPVAWLKPVMVTLIWTTAALLLLWGQYRLRRSLFRRSVFKGSPNRRALKIHKRLCQLSKWTKEPVPPELLQLAQKARFSPHTLTKPELSQLQGHLKLAESAVSLLPLPKRLLAKWLFARY